MQRRLGDEEIGDGRSVPHAVVMGEITLKAKGPVEHIGRRFQDVKRVVEVGLETVVVTGRACRVQLLELSDGAHQQRPGRLDQAITDTSVAGPGRRALVEHPAGYLHISSDRRTATSAERSNLSR